MHINITPEFLVGGNAIFTVGGPNKRFTFKITKKENQPFFVYLLTGQDNTSNYTYVGCYIPRTKDKFLKLTSKSKYHRSNQCVHVFEWAVNKVHGNYKEQSGEGYYIIHAGKCCVCGRQLTTPESIKKGIGPKCSRVRSLKTPEKQVTLF